MDSILVHCSKCNQDKPETDFYRFKTGQFAGKLKRPCKECVKALNKANYTPKRLPSPPPGQKRCSRCMQVLASTTDFFYSNKSHVDGLSTLCKACHREYEQARIQQLVKSPLPETLICTKCNTEKPATPAFFPPQHQIKSGLGSTCKVCLNAEKRVYYQTHPEFRKRLAEYEKGRSQEKKDHKKAYVRKWHHANSQRQLVYKREYRKLPHVREYRRVEDHRRRARKAQAMGFHTQQDIRKQYERQKGKCYWCGKKLGTEKRAYHVDHIVPLSRGGSNWPDNLVIACHTCNESRNNRLPSEWPQGNRLL